MKIVLWGRGRWLGPSGRERTRQGRVVKMPTSREAECWHQLPRNWTPPSAWACFCRIKLLLDNNPTSKHSIYCGTNWPKLESRQMINWSYVQMVYLVIQIHVYTYVCIILSCIGLRRCVSFLCTELFPGTGTEVFYFQIIGQQQNCAFTPIFWGTVPPLPSPPQQK